MKKIKTVLALLLVLASVSYTHLARLAGLRTAAAIGELARELVPDETVVYEDVYKRQEYPVERNSRR